MPNLSQIKRQRMLDFLETLKKEHMDDESIRAFTEIENQLRDKKYGLVWEEHSERVDEMLEENIPIFTEDTSKKITASADGVYNFILEGDNLQSLYLLNKTHRGAIDLIYIDPPYNTGSKDFIYDDAYVDSKDGYRHSKWLSFAEKRLKIAHNLLSESGLIFISISDIELYNLRLLCDEIFGENNFVANLVWTNKEGGGSSDSKLFRIKQEYILVYAKDISRVEIKGVKVSNEDRYKSSDEYESTRGKYYLQKLGMGSIQYSASLDYPIEAPDGTFVMPADNNSGKKACWRWSKPKFEWGYANGFIEMKKDRKGIWTVYTKQYLNCDNDGKIIERTQRPMGVIDAFSSTQGAKQLKQILPDAPFSYPKDTNLIAWIIERIPKKNIMVLDFFAGSGTTGQAVLEQNTRDQGTRNFILCTNNENDICDKVTYPRIRTIITGTSPNNNRYSEGIETNLKYFKCDWTPRKPEDYLLSNALCLHIREMIELQRGVEIDNVRNVLILNKADFRKYVMDDAVYGQIENIWVNQNIIFNSEEMERLNALGFKYIPREFFGQELREAAE
ncbi:MAG: site-specific DNA-methyltransferase [Clostridia bacterium]|nr:site-specific DNA-methyltransferase [Clostridia bacterium]